MPDLGISVLLKGQNFMRMLAGLGVALKISCLLYTSPSPRDS